MTQKCELIDLDVLERVRLALEPFARSVYSTRVTSATGDDLYNVAARIKAQGRYYEIYTLHIRDARSVYNDITIALANGDPVDAHLLVNTLRRFAACPCPARQRPGVTLGYVDKWPITVGDIRTAKAVYDELNKYIRENDNASAPASG